jgi:uncharacterized membrane protein YphA (DoxX/SURF4 family)
MFEMLASPYLILFARFCLGGVLILGAIGKLLDARNAPAAVAAHVPFLPPALARVAAVALPWVELIVGGLLVLGLGLVPVALVAGAMMLVFTVVVARDVVQNRRTPCSCFGRFSSENVSELTVGRDLFLLALAGLIAVAPNRYLAVDALLQPGPVVGPPVMDAIPVALLAVAAVVLVVLGGSMVATIRGFLRAF